MKRCRGLIPLDVKVIVALEAGDDQKGSTIIRAVAKATPKSRVASFREPVIEKNINTRQ